MTRDSKSTFGMYQSKGRAFLVLTLGVISLMSVTILGNYQQHIQGQGTIECISIRSNETSVAGPSPSPNVIQELPGEVTRGFSNISDVQQLTGDNFAILLNNKDISNPSLTIAEGLERAQLGEGIPGQQGTILEGDILRNVTNVCWQK